MKNHQKTKENAKKKARKIWYNRKRRTFAPISKRQLIVLLKISNHTMKKLVFMFVAFAAISFASCGNKTSDAAATDSTADTTVVDTTASDSAAADATGAATDSANAETPAEPAA